MMRREKWILAGALTLASLLRFIPISVSDLYGDGAINSFRALGWFDWLGYSGQSTPFEWLGYIPAWAELSFHDAPPLVFYIQHAFFSIFGSSTVAARLPFVLAGIVSVALIYFFLRKIPVAVGQNAPSRWPALLGAVLSAGLSYVVWAEHSAYLEGIEAFFILGSLAFGGLFMFVEQEKKYLYAWVTFIALALISKYTALFLIPPAIIYAWLYRKDIWVQRKHVLAALGVALLVISPVVIYNANMYQLRGHFDAALSSIVGMHPEDFWIISDRAPSLDLVSNSLSFFQTIAQNVSYPLLALSGICILMLLWRVRMTGIRTPEAWVLANAFFLLLLFSFAGTADRFLSISGIFIVLVIALGVPLIFGALSRPALRKGLAVLVVLVMVFELAYSVNTNVLRRPVGPAIWLYSPNKLEDRGFNQLDAFLRSEVIGQLPRRGTVRLKADTVFTDEDIIGRSVVVYDDRIDWFAQMWYMQKYLLYYRYPVISTSFLDSMGAGDAGLKALTETSGKPIYFVYPIHSGILDGTRAVDTTINTSGPALAKRLEDAGVPVRIIENGYGIPVFKVYEVTPLGSMNINHR